MAPSTPSDVLHYCWIDLELTGLVDSIDRIVEVGVIGTNSNLDELFDRKWVVDASWRALARIKSQPIVKKMHESSGLLADLTSSDKNPSIGQVEQALLDIIDTFPKPTDGRLILAGSGVRHCDIRFIKRWMPSLAARFDDREMLDIGHERRAYHAATGTDLTPVNGNKNHRADVDIRCSLEEGRAFFRLYRELAGVTA